MEELFSCFEGSSASNVGESHFDKLFEEDNEVFRGKDENEDFFKSSSLRLDDNESGDLGFLGSNPFYEDEEGDDFLLNKLEEMEESERVKSRNPSVKSFPKNPTTSSKLSSPKSQSSLGNKMINLKENEPKVLQQHPKPQIRVQPQVTQPKPRRISVKNFLHNPLPNQKSMMKRNYGNMYPVHIVPSNFGHQRSPPVRNVGPQWTSNTQSFNNNNNNNNHSNAYNFNTNNSGSRYNISNSNFQPFQYGGTTSMFQRTTVVRRPQVIRIGSTQAPPPPPPPPPSSFPTLHKPSPSYITFNGKVYKACDSKPNSSFMNIQHQHQHQPSSNYRNVSNPHLHPHLHLQQQQQQQPRERGRPSIVNVDNGMWMRQQQQLQLQLQQQQQQQQQREYPTKMNQQMRKKNVSHQTCCSIQNCDNEISNRTRFCLKMKYTTKYGFPENGMDKICDRCYFKDLYQYKKMNQRDSGGGGGNPKHKS